MNEKPRQAKSIRAQLLTAMREGEYAHCDRLPRESVLSERLGISRTQLRDILASLDREGFITRRHGVGTVINRHVLGAQARMDIEVEFMDMIRQSGRTPGLAFVRAAELPADDRIAAKLGISAGTPLLRISRLCTADGHPAIYCEDMVEKSRLYQCGAASAHLRLFAGGLRYLPLYGPDRPAALNGRCVSCRYFSGPAGNAAAEYGRGGL